MRVSADIHICVASGQCAMLAPDTFTQREEDGIVSVLDEQPPLDQHDRVRQAAASCPSGAIQLAEPTQLSA